MLIYDDDGQIRTVVKLQRISVGRADTIDLKKSIISISKKIRENFSTTIYPYLHGSRLYVFSYNRFAGERRPIKYICKLKKKKGKIYTCVCNVKMFYDKCFVTVFFFLPFSYGWF